MLLLVVLKSEAKVEVPLVVQIIPVVNSLHFPDDCIGTSASFRTNRIKPEVNFVNYEYTHGPMTCQSRVSIE